MSGVLSALVEMKQEIGLGLTLLDVESLALLHSTNFRELLILPAGSIVWKYDANLFACLSSYLNFNSALVGVVGPQWRSIQRLLSHQ